MNNLSLKLRGFTLLEVLVALVIIGIAMVTLLTTQARNTRSYAESKVMTISSLLACRKLAELQAGDYPDPIEESGVFEDNDNYRWTLSIDETDLEELREVVLTVSLASEEDFEEEAGIPGVTIVTYLADPGETEEEGEDEGYDEAG